MTFNLRECYEFWNEYSSCSEAWQDDHNEERLMWLDKMERAIEAECRVPENSTVTVLPDGSAFGVISFPLPKDHWLYTEREYAPEAIEPIDLPTPILTHVLRKEVVAAMRYAIRAATNCGTISDFDPDALVQNAVYALCGPYGAAAPKPEKAEPDCECGAVASEHCPACAPQRLCLRQRKSGGTGNEQTNSSYHAPHMEP